MIGGNASGAGGGATKTGGEEGEQPVCDGGEDAEDNRRGGERNPVGREEGEEDDGHLEVESVLGWAGRFDFWSCRPMFSGFAGVLRGTRKVDAGASFHPHDAAHVSVE